MVAQLREPLFPFKKEYLRMMKSDIIYIYFTSNSLSLEKWKDRKGQKKKLNCWQIKNITSLKADVTDSVCVLMFSAWTLWKFGGKAKHIILRCIRCHQTPPSHITGVCNYFLQVMAERRLRASTEVTEDSLWNLEGRSMCIPPPHPSVLFAPCSKILTWQTQ